MSDNKRKTFPKRKIFEPPKKKKVVSKAFNDEVEKEVDVVEKDKDYLNDADSRLNQVKPGIDQVKPGLEPGIDQVKPDLEPGVNQVKPGIDQVKPDLEPGVNQVKPGIDQVRPGLNKTKKAVDLNSKNILKDSNEKSHKPVVSSENQSKVDTELSCDFSSESLYDLVHCLTVNQRKVLFFIANIVIKKGGLDTGFVSRKFICESIVVKGSNLSYDSLRTIEKRLKKLKLIEIARSYGGKGGAIVYQLFNNNVKMMLTDIMSLQKKSNSEEFVETSLHESISLPLDWRKLEFSALEELGFGLGELILIYKKQQKNNQVFPGDVMQKSIDVISMDIMYSAKSFAEKKSLLDKFIRLTSASWPYQSEAHRAESMKMLAIDKFMSSNKHLAELKKQEDAKDKELFELMFLDWFNNLKEGEINSMISEELKNNFKYMPESVKNKYLKDSLKDKYLKEIWIKERDKVLSSYSVHE